MAITSPNMSLTIPQAGIDPGPEWAVNTQKSLSIIDAHTHNPGSGVPITPLGLNINADLTFQQNNLTVVRTVTFFNQSGSLSTADKGCVYEAAGDLYYNNGLTGFAVQITNGNAIAGSPGSITNLTSPASAVYTPSRTNGTIRFFQDIGLAANLDGGSLIIRPTGSTPTWTGRGIAIQAPSALGSGAQYVLTLPQALPGATSFVQLDSSGNIGATAVLDNTTLGFSGNLIQVKNASIGTNQIAAGGVATVNILANSVTEPKLSIRTGTVSNIVGTIHNTGSAGLVSTGITITIAAATGRWVWIGLIPHHNSTSTAGTMGVSRGAASGGVQAQFVIQRFDNTASNNLTIAQTQIVFDLGGTLPIIQEVPCGSFWAYDTSAIAGHNITYTLYFNNLLGAGQDTYLRDVQLVAYEML